MDELLSGFENIKISAFSKLSTITGNVNNVTIGPNITILQSTREDRVKTPKKEKKKKPPQKTSPQNPLHHVLQEFENQRRGKVEEAVNERLSKIEDFTRKLNEEKQNKWLVTQQRFVDSFNQNEEIVLRMLNQPDLDSNRWNEKWVKRYQEMLRRQLEGEQQIERNREKQRILNENIEKIQRSQEEFVKVYQEIIEFVKGCTPSEELRGSLGERFKFLKMLQEGFAEIIAKCKNFAVDDEQQIKAAKILKESRALKDEIQDTVYKINARRKEEEDMKVAAAAAAQQRMQEAKPELKAKDTVLRIGQCVSVDNLKRYVEVRQFLLQYTQTIKELEDNPQLKQFRFDCKKAVNIPVNALSALNSEHLKDKYTKLSNLLSGKTILVADKQINASKYPQGIAFCIDLLAKKFVLQGDLLISSNPEAAFCYATVIISLWNEFPDFGKLVLAHFYTQSPYLVPFYIPKTEEQTTEQYYTSLGYRYIDGQIEKQDKFLKRMTGIFRLYFAIFIAKPRRGQLKNPHNIKFAWNFLVSILKLDPQLDITATAIHIFLETVGFEMEAIYGVAFKKLLRIIDGDFLQRLKKIDEGGPVSRLEVLLQEYKSKGRFEKPNGLLSANFW